MTYHEAVTFIEQLSLISKGDYMSVSGTVPRELYLKRMNHLLDVIGHPERSLPHFIHIGGTSGKGTTSHTIAEALKQQGYRAGLYTSPHVTTTIERFWMNGKLMSPKRYVELVEWIKPFLLAELTSSPYGLPSFFEIEFAIALEHFRRERVEWAVIEVGCGGEFDATNVIPPPDATVITNIGLDHTDLLGSTKSAIAKTKAGIIKPGSVFFTGESSPTIRGILKARAKHHRVPFTYVPGGNTALATAVVTHLFPKHTAAITTPKLPGRFEQLQSDPLVVLDVAHNPDKMNYLADQWRAAYGNRKPHVLCAIANNKDHRNILKPLQQIAKHFTFVPFASGSRTCANPADLARISKSLNPRITTRVSLSSHEALQDLLTKKEPILITGSFFLGCDLRPHWIPEKTILRSQNSFGTA